MFRDESSGLRSRRALTSEPGRDRLSEIEKRRKEEEERKKKEEEEKARAEELKRKQEEEERKRKEEEEERKRKEEEERKRKEEEERKSRYVSYSILKAWNRPAHLDISKLEVPWIQFWLFLVLTPRAHMRSNYLFSLSSFLFFFFFFCQHVSNTCLQKSFKRCLASQQKSLQNSHSGREMR